MDFSLRRGEFPVITDVSPLRESIGLTEISRIGQMKKGLPPLLKTSASFVSRNVFTCLFFPHRYCSLAIPAGTLLRAFPALICAPGILSPVGKTALVLRQVPVSPFSVFRVFVFFAVFLIV